MTGKFNPTSEYPIGVFISEYLNRFRSGLTQIAMIWTVKRDIDAARSHLDRNAIRGRKVSIRV